MSFNLINNHLVLTVSLPQLLAINREMDYFCICGSYYCHHSGMSMDMGTSAFHHTSQINILFLALAT